MLTGPRRRRLLPYFYLSLARDSRHCQPYFSGRQIMQGTAHNEKEIQEKFLQKVLTLFAVYANISLALSQAVRRKQNRMREWWNW